MKWILAAIAVVGLVVLGKLWEWSHRRARRQETVSPAWLTDHENRQWK